MSKNKNKKNRKKLKQKRSSLDLQPIHPNKQQMTTTDKNFTNNSQNMNSKF